MPGCMPGTETGAGTGAVVGPPAWYPQKEHPSVRDVVRLLRRHRAEILQLLSEWLGDDPFDEEEAA